MKKHLILFLAVISASFFTSCEKDDDFTPPNYVTFESNSMEYAVEQNGSGSFDVTVYTANKTGSDRTFNITVDGSSSADPASYEVPATVIVPANSNEATFTINVTDNNISNSGNTLVLNIAGSEAYTGENLVVNLTRDCPSDLAGTYDVLSSGSSTDGAPANNPIVDFPYQVTITKTADKTYEVSDIFAGVYEDWYCEAYGYCFETPATIKDVCGNLSGSFEDGFESAVTVTGTNNYDGTLTITWENDFGDTATATYTLVQDSAE